jgi:uncharacterized phage protein (TIGR02220 family)
LIRNKKKFKDLIRSVPSSLLVGWSHLGKPDGVFSFMNHSFDVGYAKKYGVDEAIMICNFQYWLKKNWANDKHRHDGHTWTYNSVASFEKLFPYWTGKQIRRILDSLVSQGVLMRGEYNKSVYDRTSWYAFADESTFLFENLDLPKWETQGDDLGEPIPNINTYINTDEKPIKKDVELQAKIQAIIARINGLANTSFKPDNKETQKLISARLKEYSMDELLLVTEYKAASWLKDEKMREYFRPSTLFRPTHFENYLNAARQTGLGDISHVNNPDFKLGAKRYRPREEFATYKQYLENCQKYGHIPQQENDYESHSI